MSYDPGEEFLSALSPSARAVLRALQKLENGEEVSRFQQGRDTDMERLISIVSNYRGSICRLVRNRLKQVIEQGGISIITQPDLMGLIEEVYAGNISRITSNELKVLEGSLKHSDHSIADLAKKIGLSYSKIRRARDHLLSTGTLRVEGRLNVAELGLDRILIILQDPDFIPICPYFEKTLFIDGAPRFVFLTGLTPSYRRELIHDTIRSLRNVTGSVSIWHLSTGRPLVGTAYHSKKSKRFSFDKFHYRLSLADTTEITIGEFAAGLPNPPAQLTKAEVKILDHLTKNYDDTAQEIAKATKLSESTVFRRKAHLINKGYVLPRPIVSIPDLSDRVIAILDPDCAGRVMNSWRMLPVTYMSKIENLENMREKKILLATALPRASASELVDVLESEKSKADDYSLYTVASASENRLSVRSLYDSKQNLWKFESSFIDLIHYGVSRNDSSATDMPLDLA